jgi:hypothetical protein
MFFTTYKKKIKTFDGSQRGKPRFLPNKRRKSIFSTFFFVAPENINTPLEEFIILCSKNVEKRQKGNYWLAGKMESMIFFH